jgi:tRNA U55 pseudouridine synthase TruB
MKEIKNLSDTVDLMTSTDYKERFKAEYYQTKIRYDKLKAMCDKWDKGELDFTPTCTRDTYTRQIAAMIGYLDILIARSIVEKIEL